MIGVEVILHRAIVCLFIRNIWLNVKGLRCVECRTSKIKYLSVLSAHVYIAFDDLQRNPGPYICWKLILVNEHF